MFDRADPEVLVVGSGPIGLMAALQLSRRGIGVELIDQDQRTSQHSYALALHSSTVARLNEVGLASALAERGRALPRMAFYEGADRHAEIDFSPSRGERRAPLVVRQSLLERAIEDELRRRKLKVRWNHRLQFLRGNGDATIAEIARLDRVALGYPVQRNEWVIAKTFDRRPRFIIGADGYDSAVRRLSEIRTTTLGTSMLMSIYEFEADGDLPDEARVHLDPDATSVYWPLELKRCRWSFSIRDAAEHEASNERLQSLLTARAPWFKAQPTTIYWSTMVLFEQRLAERFGKGAAWLAGDAAHLAAPIGVHSLNAGLEEACQLAAMIAAILRDGSPRSSLDEYDVARRAEWRSLCDGNSVHALPDADGWVRDHRARILGCVPASGDDRDLLLRQIGLTTRQPPS